MFKELLINNVNWHITLKCIIVKELSNEIKLLKNISCKKQKWEVRRLKYKPISTFLQKTLFYFDGW